MQYLKTKKREKVRYKKFDYCIVVTQHDKDILDLYSRDLNITVIPNGIDLSYFKPMDVKEIFPSLIFVGDMGTPPNMTAVSFFYSEIYLLIKKQMPDVKLYLVGRNPSTEISKLSRDESVVVTGYVADVRPYLAKASVVVTPMILGMGIKNKVLEAMAMDKPVVSTSLGARGILEMQKLGNNLYSKFVKYKSEKLADNPNSLNVGNRTITSTLVLLFITFTLTWYMYVSSSSAFNVIVHIGDHIASSIFTDFLNSMANLFILFAAISVPFFASSLNIERLYHITLIFLAPFCVMGGITVLRMLSKVVRVAWTNKSVRISLKVLFVYFVIFMLYQTGFVYGVAEDNFCSISLNSTMDYPRFNDQEVLGAKWLIEVRSDKLIYADEYRWQLLGSFEWEKVKNFPADVDRLRIPKDSYIYFGTLNVMKDEVIVRRTKGVTHTMECIDSEDLINEGHKIYANGGARVYIR